MNIKKALMALALRPSLVMLTAIIPLSFAGAANATMQSDYNGYPTDAAIKKVEAERPAFTHKVFKSEKFIKKFESGNMDGWVVQFTNPSNEPDFMLTYTTKDGKNLILGHVFDENGNNLTAVDSKHIPTLNYNSFRDEIEAAKVITEGSKNAKKVIYAFIDPDCIYCHQLWEDSRPYIGEASIKWIPVSILSEESFGKSAALLQAKDPVNLLSEHELTFKETRGIRALGKDEITSQAAEDINKNTELMKKMKITGTPAIVVIDDAGDIKVMNGAPAPEVLEKLMKG